MSIDPPEIPILLLGDAGIGKTTFLSRLTLGSTTTKATPRSKSLPVLRDLDQPFPFNVSLYNRPYRLTFSDTASPENYTLLRPALVILCYSIADPESLASVKTHWHKAVQTQFNHDEVLPVILLGLCRDVREKEDYDGKVRTLEGSGTGEGEVLNGRRIVYPQEALQVAQEMRVDRYCECSALTGELCREAFEDIARTAARTTTEKGAKSEGTQCSMM